MEYEANNPMTTAHNERWYTQHVWSSAFDALLYDVPGVEVVR